MNSVVRNLTFLFLSSYQVLSMAQVTVEKSEFLKACSEGDSKKVSSLIKAGSDVNEQNEFGKTCLMFAIEFDHKKIEATLLKSKSLNIQLQDKAGVSALWLAAELDRRSLAKKLVANGAKTDIANLDSKDNLVHVLARTGNTDLLAKVMSKNSSQLKTILDAQNSLGETPLMTAIVFRQREVTRVLVKNGADQTLKNKDGKSAKDIATGIKDDLVLKILAKGL